MYYNFFENILIIIHYFNLLIYININKNILIYINIDNPINNNRNNKHFWINIEYFIFSKMLIKYLHIIL